MGKQPTFRQLMIEALEQTGMSVAELSRRSGVTYDVINKVKRREAASTNAENAQAIAGVLGFDWAGGDLSPAISLDGSSESSALIPVYDVQASAGNGALVADHEAITESLAFPPHYLRSLTSTSPRHLSIIGVTGDSMTPTLKHDDIVMLDRSKTSLSYDGLFVIRHRDVLHVKRVTWSERKGYVTVLSDNKEYPPREYLADDVVVIGKVIWSGGKV